MKSTVLLKIVIIIIAIFIIVNNLIFVPGNILSWDVFGYYLYLPLKFIYDDLGLKNFYIINNIIEKYHNTSTFYQAMQLPDGNYVLKYTMGLSFFYTPFFLTGHFIAKVFNYPVDGFSIPYQYSILIGGSLYSIIGICVLSRILVRLFNEYLVVFILIIIVFSTNYLIHITMYGQNTMSHNYLFTAYTLIIWLTILWYESYKFKYAIWLAVICGITILSRPSEIVCLIIPALWGVNNDNFFAERVALFYKYKIQIFLFVAILLLFGLFQMIYWKIYTGNFIFYSYGGNAGEGFEFFSPFILKVLFSFRKGWLIYTPVMFFSIAGFYFMYKKNKSIFYSLFIYFILNIYIVSSWSCWWYAQSFSQRALIPSYPIMVIALGYFLTWLSNQKFLKGIIFLLIGGCICLNLYQTIQFHNGTIDGDRMTKKYYLKVFGKMYATEEDKKLLLIKRSFDGVETFENEKEYSSKLLRKLDFENSAKRDSTVFYSGRYSFKIDSSEIYSPGIESPYYEITNKDHAFVKVTAYVYPTADIVSDPFSLVVQFVHNNNIYKYIAYDSENMNIQTNKWNKITFDYLTPEVRDKRDFLKVYFWHRGRHPVFVDDLQVDIFERKY